MIAPDPLARWNRVEGWIRHAGDDARIARGCLGLDPPARGGAAYHCQQAVEKLLKGFLVLAGIDFRRTHDLDALAQSLLPHFPVLRPLLMVIGGWTAWGVAYRYPAEDEPEPEPGMEELAAALDAIGQLDATLRSWAPSPSDNAGTGQK
ncbi:MAG TPA: HEPN domain-containing protein [Rhodopila sp.]|nr:HEPN domain-containing protein [Rhodopila sp.]